MARPGSQLSGKYIYITDEPVIRQIPFSTDISSQVLNQQRSIEERLTSRARAGKKAQKEMFFTTQLFSREKGNPCIMCAGEGYLECHQPESEKTLLNAPYLYQGLW